MGVRAAGLGNLGQVLVVDVDVNVESFCHAHTPTEHFKLGCC